MKRADATKPLYERFWQSCWPANPCEKSSHNKTRDGRFITVESSISSVLDAQGRRIGFIAVQDDVTERKRAEEALRQSEQRFSLAFHASPVPIIIRDIGNEPLCPISTNTLFASSGIPERK